MSCMLNVTGRVGSVELRTLSSGTAATRISVCSQLKSKDAEGNYRDEWTNFDSYGKLAEMIARVYGKGDIVYVSAEKRTTKNGDKYFTNFTISDIERLQKNPKRSNETEQQGAGAQGAPTAPTVSDEEYEDIPF